MQAQLAITPQQRLTFLAYVAPFAVLTLLFGLWPILLSVKVSLTASASALKPGTWESVESLAQLAIACKGNNATPGMAQGGSNGRRRAISHRARCGGKLGAGAVEAVVAVQEGGVAVAGVPAVVAVGPAPGQDGRATAVRSARPAADRPGHRPCR